MRTNKQNPKVVFKQYNQHQLHLLPPSLEELIPENHLVRIVNSSIDKLHDSGKKAGDFEAKFCKNTK